MCSELPLRLCHRFRFTKPHHWQEIEYRLDILRATNGAYVQLY
jgi:hypothetical protein